MNNTIQPCHCGYDKDLTIDNMQGIYYRIQCPKCPRVVEAFTPDGLLKQWNKPENRRDKDAP